MKKYILLILGVMTFSYGFGYDKWILGDSIKQTLQKAKNQDLTVSSVICSDQRGYKHSYIAKDISTIKRLCYNSKILNKNSQITLFFSEDTKKMNKISVYITTITSMSTALKKATEARGRVKNKTKFKEEEEVMTKLTRLFTGRHGKYYEEPKKIMGEGKPRIWEVDKNSKIVLTNTFSNVRIDYIDMGYINNKSKKDLTKF